MTANQMNQAPNRAILLDRDGTIIREGEVIRSLEENTIFDFSAQAISIFRKLGFKIIIVTNQSGVARGIFNCEEVDSVHRELQNRLKKQGAEIDAIYYCPYHPEGTVAAYSFESYFRKPQPGMLLQAAADFDLNLSQSYMIGDMRRDLEAGKSVNCRTILVRTGKGGETEIAMQKEPGGVSRWADGVADNLLCAAQAIKNGEI